MVQEHAQKAAQPQTQPEVDKSVPQGDAEAQKQSAITEDLLDEIDEVLETNAEEFVNAYVQKGGQ